jgi:cell division protein FtsN
MQKIVIIALVSILLAGGCDFIKKVNPFSKKEDTMAEYLQREDSIRRAELLRTQQMEARLREQALADSIRRAQEAEAAKAEAAGRYHLIVGAFKTPAFADEFHDRIRSGGYDSRIIMSDNDFHLVTIKSFNDYRTAVNEWIRIRGEGEHLVWLYIKDI